MVLGSTQPLTEMSNRNLLWQVKGGRTPNAKKLTTICESTAYKMWEPRHLTTLWASTTCNRDSFTLCIYVNVSIQTPCPVTINVTILICTILQDNTDFCPLSSTVERDSLIILVHVTLCFCVRPLKFWTQIWYASSAIFLIVIVGVESNWVHSALWPRVGLFCQPRVNMMMEKLVEWLAGETEILGENLPQCRFAYHKPHILPGRGPGPPRW
jgi:hypothetical protein